MLSVDGACVGLLCHNESKTWRLFKLLTAPHLLKSKQKCHCPAFHQRRASALTDIVFAFPQLCIFRTILVWHIQYVNAGIVRLTKRGPMIMEQEMTFQNPGDLRGKAVTSGWPLCLSSVQTVMVAGWLLQSQGGDAERWESCVSYTHTQGRQQCAGNSLWNARSFKNQGNGHSVQVISMIIFVLMT